MRAEKRVWGKFTISTLSLEHGRAALQTRHQMSSSKEQKTLLNTQWKMASTTSESKLNPAGSNAETREEDRWGTEGLTPSSSL